MLSSLTRFNWRNIATSFLFIWYHCKQSSIIKLYNNLISDLIRWIIECLMRPTELIKTVSVMKEYIYRIYIYIFIYLYIYIFIYLYIYIFIYLYIYIFIYLYIYIFIYLYIYIFIYLYIYIFIYLYIYIFIYLYIYIFRI
jgi:hypothetical protein